MEEHLMYYFKSDNSRADYNDYVKVVRVYPDYVSSACHTPGASEADYSSIEGCANYNQKEASINLNGLVNIERFFKPLNRTEGGYTYYSEPKRDTFAHEFGHVSTYYNLILKGEGVYSDYLHLRLGSAYDEIYPAGLPATYDSSMTYNIQPVEILADDYVELFYDTSKKAYTDYYEYDLTYRDLRNSLDGVSNVHKFLKSDTDFYNTIKDYYSNFINNRRNSITPRVVSATGKVYANPYDVKHDTEIKELTDKKLIAIEEVTIDNRVYYRVVLANYITNTNARYEYASNIGYILKSECTSLDQELVFFTKYYGSELNYNQYYTIEAKGVIIYPHYDFSYFYIEGDDAVVYNAIDDTFVSFTLDKDNFM